MANVLLIEDNPGDARLISELLKDTSTLISTYHITHVERVKDAVKILHKPHAVDAIISDITLPDSQGLETLASMSGAAADLPTIFMTGTNDEALAIAALHKGAQDYFVKGQITGDTLARTLQYAIERKKTQNEMQRIRAQDEVNQQRIKLLATQKKQLLELNRSKDEFVSMASHQLRTPPTAVKQYLGMMLEGFAGDIVQQQLELLRGAYESNERQLDVINELLKTAQLDSRKFILKPKETDITALITDIILQQQPIITSRQQTILFDTTSAWTALVDEAEMRIVLENLLENASKYTPSGKTISIMVSQSAKKFTIAIHDEGVGIAPANQERIFEKFTRVDNDLSDTVTGSGLGLYWARKIVRLHKGTLTVSSASGRGSTFIIRLPI